MPAAHISPTRAPFRATTRAPTRRTASIASAPLPPSQGLSRAASRTRKLPSAPDPIRSVLERSFPREPRVDRQQLRLCESKEAVYSITQPAAAAETVSVLRGVLARRHVLASTATIIDATACCGGDTLHFAKLFRHVHAIEKNPLHLAMLTHNLGIYERSNVTTHLGDACRIVPTLNADVVFFDPPWGGPRYKHQRLLRLYLSRTPMHEVAARMLARVPVVVLKVPWNTAVQPYVAVVRRVSGRNLQVFHLRQFMLLVLTNRVAQAALAVRTKSAPAGSPLSGQRSPVAGTGTKDSRSEEAKKSAG